MKYVKLFVSHLLEFFDDIILVFPNDNRLIQMRNFLKIYAKINPKALLKTWKYYVTDKYKETILDGSSNDIIEFMCAKDYSGDLDLEGETEVVTKNFIENMREPIRQMSDNNKEKTVKYLSNLIKISELV
tara:strand:- start:6602 stop:6991 length:390 start_codon:yes stop_codon:yes gene_type:complete